MPKARAGGRSNWNDFDYVYHHSIQLERAIVFLRKSQADKLGPDTMALMEEVRDRLEELRTATEAGRS